MLKKFINISLIALFATSCGDTLGSVKRGLTGAKADSSDEFLIQKKDPLILPPDFENLPTPSEREEALGEMTDIEKTLKKINLILKFSFLPFLHTQEYSLFH